MKSIASENLRHLNLQSTGGCATSSTIADASISASQFDKALIYRGKRTQIQAPLPGATQYRIFHRGATGFTPLSAVRRSVMQRIDEFCNQKNMNPYLIEETTSRPLHILGNWPRVEVVFSCVKTPDTEHNESSSLDKYDKIQKIKSLLDQKAITHEEYEKEKNILLDHYEIGAK